MSELTRRRLLAVSGVATMGAVAGCTGSSDDEQREENGENGNENDDDGNEDDGENGETRTESSGTVLGGITVENLHEEAHTVDVLVEFAGEIEHWTTHSLEAGGDGADVERDWPSEAGDFRVTLRIDGEEIEQVTAAEWNEPDCLSMVVLIDRTGTVRVTGDTDAGVCDPENGDGD